MTCCELCGFNDCLHARRNFCLYLIIHHLTNSRSVLTRFTNIPQRWRCTRPRRECHCSRRRMISSSTFTNQVVQLTARMKLERLHSERRRWRNRSRGRLRNWNRRRQASSSTSASDNTGLCYYHERFGDRAYNCRSPCSKQNVIGSRNSDGRQM